MYLENEIRACKHVLSDSDGQILGALEGLLNCTTSTAVVNYLKAVPADVKELLAYRAIIRGRMKLMQAALDGEPVEEPEPVEEFDPDEAAPEPEEGATQGEEGE